MQLSPTGAVNFSSASQEIIVSFLCPKSDQSSPFPHIIFGRCNLVLSPISTYVSLETSCPQSSPPKHCMHLSFLPYVPHSPPIPFFLIWSPEEYLMRLTDHKVANYVVFSSPSPVPVPPAAPYPDTLSSSLIVEKRKSNRRWRPACNDIACGYSLQCVRAVRGNIRCQSHKRKLIACHMV
jgi:hypothetical protein